jgi:hypothetical protein
MHRLVALALSLWLAGCSTSPPAADPASDAPEGRIATGAVVEAASYAEALARWHDAADVNAWIAARFEYDRARALQLSETQRRQNGRLAIHAPDAFFAEPRGVCVDLARFAVETLRTIHPEARPGYLMIEFDPITIGGNLLRRHWVATYERDGALYVFADSKRPGHVAGPYARLDDYIAEYARYRGRAIVSFRALDSYERRPRALAAREARQNRSPP